MIRRWRHQSPVRRIWTAVLLIAVLLSLNDCGGSSSPRKTITQRQTVGQLIVALETPEQAQLLTEQEVLVTLNDAQGKPLDGAEVWLALIMPTMQMSPNEPDAIAEGNGRYRAKAIFTMAGTWNLEVHATVLGQEHVASFRAQTS
jgi:nitrogen fixation protein FixH